MSYAAHLGVYLSIYFVLALGLSSKVGYTGLLSLAHAAHFALGGYAYAILSVAYGWPFLPALISSVVVGALSGGALAAMGRGMRGDSYVLVTLAFQALAYAMLMNWTSPGAPVGSLFNLTNGSFGIDRIPGPTVDGEAWSEPTRYIGIAAIGAVACLLVAQRLDNSPWSRALFAVRDDELAARMIGKDARSLRAQAIWLSAGMAGLAGGLYAAYAGYLDPSSAHLNESLMLLSMVLLGGAVGLWGPFTGALIFVLAPEVLRAIDNSDIRSANLRLLLFGLLLVVVAHARPQGIAGRYRIQ